MNFQLTEKEARQYSPLTMAFLGDCVYELLVRSAIVSAGSTPVGNLHDAKIKLVCAGFQAKAADALMDRLTEEERSVYQRGRNAAGNTVPRNASPADYRKATGLKRYLAIWSFQAIHKDSRLCLLRSGTCGRSFSCK